MGRVSASALDLSFRNKWAKRDLDHYYSQSLQALQNIEDPTEEEVLELLGLTSGNATVEIVCKAGRTEVTVNVKMEYSLNKIDAEIELGTAPDTKVETATTNNTVNITVD